MLSAGVSLMKMRVQLLIASAMAHGSLTSVSCSHAVGSKVGGLCHPGDCSSQGHTQGRLQPAQAPCIFH